MKILIAVLMAHAACLGSWCEDAPPAPAQARPLAPTPACSLCPAEVPSLRNITETKWLDAALRKKAFSKAYEVTNQNGRQLKLDELLGKPIALTFLYTRCENPNKCPLTASTFAKLQDETRTAGIDKKVRLLVMTYDPEFDSSGVLNRYAQEKKIVCNDDVMLLRPNPAAKNDLFDELNVMVNYNADRVNIHGLQIILLDKKGCYVRSYQTLIWDNSKVVEDLKKLVREEQ